MIKKLLNSRARRVFCSTVRKPFLWLYRFYNYLQTWQKHRDAIKHLNMLSDRELKDVGLNRNDITRLIWLKEDKDLTGTMPMRKKKPVKKKK
jgi:uncharacterized protein YjiS (DUF1127 family)